MSTIYNPQPESVGPFIGSVHFSQETAQNSIALFANKAAKHALRLHGYTSLREALRLQNADVKLIRDALKDLPLPAEYSVKHPIPVFVHDKPNCSVCREKISSS